MDHRDRNDFSMSGSPGAKDLPGIVGAAPCPGFEVGPSRRWHLATIALFFLCVFVVPYSLVGESIRQFISTVSSFEGEKFRVPGRQTFELEKPGRYVIWNEATTFYEGRRYLLPDGLPAGMSVRVIDEERGLDVPVGEDMGTTERMGGTTRNSLLSFEIDHPGTYTVIVANLDVERIFMLRPSLIGQFRDFFVSTGKRLGLAGLCIFTGFVIAPFLSILIEILRGRNRKTREQQMRWMTQQGYIPPG